MGKRKQQQQPTELDVAASARLTPLEIQQKEFAVSRFSGYRMRDVDEFLDQVTDSVSALIADNERLRAGAPVVGAPDMDDVARQADEIIARARAEAARITAEARVGSGGPGIAGDGVDGFLTQEREFLQSLAGLVQGHAEAVKGMAKVARASARTSGADVAAAAPGASVGSEPVVAATTEGDPSADPTPATDGPAAPEHPPAPVRVPDAGAQSRTEDEPPVPAAPVAEPRDQEPTVRIDEPAPATRGRGDAEGDRSLRELFWGED